MSEIVVYTHTYLEALNGYLETPQASLRLPDERRKISWLTENTIKKELGCGIYSCIPQCTEGIPGAGRPVEQVSLQALTDKKSGNKVSLGMMNTRRTSAWCRKLLPPSDMPC